MGKKRTRNRSIGQKRISLAGIHEIKKNIKIKQESEAGGRSRTAAAAAAAAWVGRGGGRGELKKRTPLAKGLSLRPYLSPSSSSLVLAKSPSISAVLVYTSLNTEGGFDL